MSFVASPRHESARIRDGAVVPGSTAVLYRNLRSQRHFSSVYGASVGDVGPRAAFHHGFHAAGSAKTTLAGISAHAAFADAPKGSSGTVMNIIVSLMHMFPALDGLQEAVSAE